MRHILLVPGLVAVLGTACGGTAIGGGSASPTPAVGSAVRTELVPTGQLRVGFPTSAPFLGHQDPVSGQWKGLAISLGKALAAKLGVPMVPTPYAEAGPTYQALLSGDVDVVLAPLPAMPHTASGTKTVVRVEHTYLVRSDSSLRSVSDVDRQGIKVGSVDGQGHTAFLASNLQHAQLVKFANDAAALTALAAGQIDVYANVRPALVALSPRVPGSRLLDGSFFSVSIGFATLSSHAEGAAFLDSFVASQLASGEVQREVAAIGQPGVLAGPAA